MRANQPISSYTPSNTDPCVLERIFVQRQKLLDMVVQKLAGSMSTGDKHHFLLVGPRGSGKTHLLTLAHFRLQQTPALADSMRIAWLGEDTIITGLIDLALEMANQLAAGYPEEFDTDFLPSVRSLPPDDAAEAILHHLLERLGDRHLLLMMENLDRAFRGLGDTGQKKWRAFLQETGRIATLATSQQLVEGISRDEAFFGFFDIHHLDPLSVEHAQRLIANVAREYGNEDLVAFLGTNEGRYRVRALRHLAGGNHRMYILLSEFLTKESLDDLVDAFEQLAEELTPYFQERVRSLSPQQARIVQCLCNADGAMTVKAVAEDTFIPERNCSKQLGELKKKRYVRSERRGKEAYYEMAEPLMRLCLEIKNQRGRPLRLLGKFLRAWFPPEELRAANGPASETRADQYRAYALTLDDGFEDVIHEELVQEIVRKVEQQDFDRALALASELHCVDPVSELLQKGWIEHMAGQLGSALADFTAVIDMPEASVEQRARALWGRGMVHDMQGERDSALSDFSSVIDTLNVPTVQRALALMCRGVSHDRQGHPELALADFRALSGMPDTMGYLRMKAMFLMAETMVSVYSKSDAMAALARAFDEGDPTDDSYGGYPHRLLNAVLKKGHSEWSAYVSELVPIYARYGACAALGNGLTLSIQSLAEGDFSPTQLDAWDEAWQEAGGGIEELEIALRSLDCAVRAIKQKSDRPLFDLPLEIRELVAPLLEGALGEKKGT
jgi:DNA-binding transcriptional ArsR family regulator